MIFTKTAVLNGASVIGQSHVMNGTCNQDSFIIRRKSFGVALCVCDGVGSNKYSQYGSKAACKAVVKVMKRYYQHKVTKEETGAEIEKYYKRYVRKKYRPEASTTCLFTYVLENGEVLIGQAGDGIILIKKDSKFIVFQNKTDDFMNEVSPLSCNKNYRHWNIKNLRFDANENAYLAFLLSTDGISEDVIPDKRELFFDHFMKLSERNYDPALKKEIENWSVPASIDDKTVVTFEWRK